MRAGPSSTKKPDTPRQTHDSEIEMRGGNPIGFPPRISRLHRSLRPPQRRLEFLQPAQEAVDEGRRIVGGELLRELHRLVDYHGVRHLVLPDQLVGPEPQNI